MTEERTTAIDTDALALAPTLASAPLEAQWRERGIRTEELLVDDGGTIVPKNLTDGVEVASWSRLVGTLPQATSGDVPMIAVTGEIGRGGMGIVHGGRQISLGREVAVKTVLGEGRVAEMTQSLLREAWISGHLEHPNVIPVYALYRDDRAPLLVMKRVEGSSWSEAMQPAGEADVKGQLRTLIQLCHAVHFARTRGFVHLDLKPDNVMIGGFGEIYLLDWGIAASTCEDHPPFIPRTGQIRDVLGTPAYMSPEQASGDGTRLGPHTDVYLLGSVLFEILTGAPPHAGSTFMESLSSAFTSSRPDFPPEVPHELARIAARALSREPADRYPSAASLREALEDYLVHSESLAITDAAEQRLETLSGLLSGGEREEDLPDIDRFALEAEFGFRQALHVWSGNGRAQRGLQVLLELLIEADLAANRWAIAERRLVALPSPRPELERQVAELRAEAMRQDDELVRIRAEADLGRAARQRSTMATVGGVAWTVALVGLGLLDRFGVIHAGAVHMLAITCAASVIFWTLVYVGRKALFANTINRSVVSLLALGWFFGVLYWVGAIATDLPFAGAVVGIGPLIALVVAAAAATLDSRLRPHAAVAIGGAVLHPFLADYALEVLGVIGGVVLGMLGWTWRKAPRAALDGAVRTPGA